MTGRRIYIRDPQVKCCTAYECRALIDKGVSDKFCTDHSLESEAKREMEEKRKKNKLTIRPREVQ